MTDKEKLKKLRSENFYLRKENDRIYNEKLSYISKSKDAEEWINEKFNWYIDLLAEGKSPNLAWLIKNTKDVLVKLK